MQEFSAEKLETICRQARTVKDFYNHYLTTIASQSNAAAAIAWSCNSDQPEPICQVSASQDSHLRLPISETQHLELLQKAKIAINPMVVMPSEKMAAASLPTIVLGTVQRKDSVEVIEFFYTDFDASQHDTLVDQLGKACRIASGFEEKEPVAAAQTPMQRELINKKIDEYIRTIHSQLDYKATAQNIANEGRRLIDTDRVSVALRNRSQFQIQSISGQPSVNRRSNTVYLLRTLVNKVLKTGKPFWYPTEEEVAPSIESVLNDYMAVAATRSIAIVPIFDTVAQEDEPEKQKNRKVIGGVIAEICQGEWEQAQIQPLMDVMTDHAGDALRNATSHRSLFLYSLWRILGKSKVLSAARNLPKSIAALILVTLATLLLIFLPWNFNVGCDGVVVPVKRQRVYSEVDAKVTSVKIRHAGCVGVGETLLTMSSAQLDFELRDLLGQYESIRVERDKSQSQRILKDDSESGQPSQNRGTESLEKQLQSLEDRIKILKQKQQKLTIKSPIAGEVITWDIVDRLLDRPVKDGDFLIEVADVNGPWEIELALPDKKVGHVVRAYEASEEPLKVTFILASDPNRTHEGRIKSIATSTQLQSDNKQSVKIVVEFDSDAMDIQHARSGVRAKIHCGKRSLGFVWLHPVGEFLYSQVLFRIW